KMEKNLHRTFPIPALPSGARGRRFSHDCGGFEHIAFNRCLRKSRAIGAAEPGIHETGELAVNEIDLEFNRLFFLRAWRRTFERPTLRSDPRSDERRGRCILLRLRD